VTVRVLLADDQEMIRTGVRMILEAEDDLEVVGEARDGQEAVAKTRRLQPDVVLMDIRMPVLDGVDATRELRRTDPPVAARVLVLTTYDLDEYVFAALRAGADGFLLKHAASDVLVDAVRTVARGEALLAPEITRRVIEAFADVPIRPERAPVELDRLTERERDTFEPARRGRRGGSPRGRSPPEATSSRPRSSGPPSGPRRRRRSSTARGRPRGRRGRPPRRRRRPRSRRPPG
jgi:DNA-binding NarL/FixJ family response regulator